MPEKETGKLLEKENKKSEYEKELVSTNSFYVHYNEKTIYRKVIVNHCLHKYTILFTNYK